MLTGLKTRRNRFAGWSEIDMRRDTITLPPQRVKNNGSTFFHVASRSCVLIEGRSENRQNATLVFGIGEGGFSGWSQCKERLDAAVGMTGWTLHDIRRSVATGMADLGIQPHVIEADINHVTGPRLALPEFTIAATIQTQCAMRLRGGPRM